VAGTGGTSRRDFFISYTSPDRVWAEWVAWQLEDEGWTTVLQAWDFTPGHNFIERMRDALEQADRTIALLSPAYLASPYRTDEWTEGYLHDKHREGRLLPVRVEACELPRLLATRVYIDLVGLGRQQARRRLLEGVREGRWRPEREPGFPGDHASRGSGGVEEPRFPARGPRVTNLPARNPHFTGRGEVLERLRSQLRAGPGAVVAQTGAIHGLGGVGKTELALEFAHRYASDYDIVWWIAAEQPTTVTTDLAGLAEELGIARAVDQAEMVRLLFGELRGRERWLLVYDNAERPEELEGLLPPGGGGRVLVTSRYGAWGKLGSTLRLDMLPRDQATAFLAKRTGASDRVALDELAELLGDLPLALEEAAAYLEETHSDVREYLELVRELARELFGLDQPPADEQGNQRRVATVWSLSLDRVHQQAPAAEALLSLCAFLAPNVPRELPREHAEVLPNQLAAAVSDPQAYHRLLAAVGRYSLATVTPTSLGAHRLVQAVIQERLGEDGERAWAETAVDLLRASFPNESWEVETWPTCERLLPHALAVAGHAERLGVAGEQAGWLLDRASRYLWGRGLYRQARPVAEQALAVTEATLGPDHPEVARRRNPLGRVLQDLGDLEGSRAQYERALELGEAALGPDHPDVAIYRNDLGSVVQDLGDLAGARAQYERALELGEAALGPDHPTVTTIRSNLLQAVGPDHPTVTTIRSNLNSLLQALREPPPAGSSSDL
jgi:tetratricopeptide (TPR) repeat protein